MTVNKPSTKPLSIGNLELYSIETGRFKLDGGAMFGVVPKTLWNGKLECDEKNRILMATRCLLIHSKTTDRLYLVDNGCGDKFDEKMQHIYSLNFKHSELERSLEAVGVTPADITDMVFTHLHFDHCGGTTTFNEHGELKHRFKNATYHVNKRHWQTATHPNAREKASFLSENIKPIEESDRLNLVEDNHSYEEGFNTHERTPNWAATAISLRLRTHRCIRCRPDPHTCTRPASLGDGVRYVPSANAAGKRTVFGGSRQQPVVCFS